MFIMKNQTKGEKDISISIVNYNSTNYLIDCIKSIRKYSERLDIEILITDNASLDFKPSAIHEIFPDATISCNNKNRGFAYAHNQNFRLSNGKIFFILNPDTLLTDGCLRSLLGVFDKYPNAGIVTPTLLFGNNKANTTYKELPSIKSALFELLYINNLINALINKYPVYGLDSDKNIIDIPCISGAAFMVRRDVYTKLNGLDEYFFLYFEETDFCKRVNDLLGMKIYLIKDIFVQHLYGKSSLNTDFRQTIYYESYYKYFKKHFSPFKAGIIRLLIFLGGIFRFLGLNIKYFPLTKGWRVYSNKIYTSLRLIFWALGISSLSEKS
jgi:N-acetylglucosaminyl-diphospho-decaprenol L-rhamnosyltransferase